MMKILETERLFLRHLEPGDTDDLCQLYRDPEIRRYSPEETLTYQETRQELECSWMGICNTLGWVYGLPFLNPPGNSSGGAGYFPG